MDNLLSVDLGVKTGLACWSIPARLAWYRSQNYGSKERLQRATKTILEQFEQPGLIVLEGGGRLADIWISSALRNNWQIEELHAEEWRKHLINHAEWNYCTDLKKLSIKYAHLTCRWGGLPVAGTLNHNTAEAILAGLWMLIKKGLVDTPPWPLPVAYRSK